MVNVEVSNRSDEASMRVPSSENSCTSSLLSVYEESSVRLRSETAYTDEIFASCADGPVILMMSGSQVNSSGSIVFPSAYLTFGILGLTSNGRVSYLLSSTTAVEGVIDLTS